VDNWSFNGGIGYDRYAYTATAQLDNYYTVLFGAGYLINPNASVNGSVTWQYDASNAVNGSFTNTLFSLNVSFRY